MKTLPIIFFILAFTISVMAAESAEEILKAADKYRTGWESFVVKTRIINFKKDKKTEEGDFEVMFKGLEKSLVRFLKPDQKGQYLLMLEEKMWLYMPNTQRPLRVTPLQRLMGDASNGDVARSNFSRDYVPTLKGEETIAEKGYFILELKAKNEAATYQRAELWVAKGDLKPLKAELYLASGKHYKSITYDEFKAIQGRQTLVKMTLYDRLRPERHTIMEFSEYNPQEIADKYFNVNYLPKLK